MNRILLAVGLLAGGKLVGAQMTTCAADNCYRALFPCQVQSSTAWSIATSYCATITAGGTTATNFPTRATSACGTVPARYLSACACGPTCTPTPTSSPTPTPSVCNGAANPPSSNLLYNGDFECGLDSWTAQTPDTAASVSVITTGVNTGTKAVQLTLNHIQQSPVLGVSARIISSPVSVVGNVPLRVVFYTKFAHLSDGFVGVLINGSPVWTVDATDHGADSVGKWNKNQFDWTPGPDVNSITLTFESLFGSSAIIPASHALDSINVNFLH